MGSILTKREESRNQDDDDVVKLVSPSEGHHLYNKDVAPSLFKITPWCWCSHKPPALVDRSRLNISPQKNISEITKFVSSSFSF